MLVFKLREIRKESCFNTGHYYDWVNLNVHGFVIT